jgi:hypothetical protein
MILSTNYLHLMYMNFIRNTLFFHVAVIALLHIFIPHRHHGEMTYDEHWSTHKNAKGIIGFISLAFQNGSSDTSQYFIFSEQDFQNKIKFKNLDLLRDYDFTQGDLSLNLFLKILPHKLYRNLNILFYRLRGPPNYGYFT